MIPYQDGFAIPLGAGVFEVANLFLLLRIDTDDGQALADKSFSLLSGKGTVDCDRGFWWKRSVCGSRGV
jgi:hypothetical protein